VITETTAIAGLPGGALPYVLRRSPRSRNLRLVVHPQRGVVVSVPPASRRGWARAEGRVEAFLAERETWIRRHLDRQASDRARLAARPALEDGREVPYLGTPHRVRETAAPPGMRATRVSRVGGDEADELLVERVPRDRRPVAAILEAWFRTRARVAIAAALRRHAPELGVTPGRLAIRDTSSRWGSCSRARTLSFSWRLILAPPPALEAVAVHELCHLRVFGHGPAFRELLDAHAPDHVAWRRWLRRHAAELHASLD
jgi:predicted metal-dependent hydrolase